MKTRFDQLSQLFCYATFLWIALQQAVHADEPTYQGRTVSSWLQDFSYGRHFDYEASRIATEKHEAAERAIRSLGTNALPVLTDRLRVSSASQNSEQDVRTYLAFSALGAEARSAIPVLLDLMTPAYDAAQRSRLGYDPGDIKPIYVALSLHAIGRDAVAPLINALSAEDKRIRFGAAMALESFRGFGDDVVPALIKALKDQDHNVRWRAARSLGSLQQLPDITVPALVESLAKDSDENVRCYVIFALKKFGLQASASIAELTKATSDPNAVIRSYAIDALKAIGPVQAARADAGQPAAGDYRLEDKAKSQR
jgi:hypothetical protein